MILNYSSNENERDEVNALSRQIAIPIHIGLELAHVNTSFTFHFRPLHRSNFSIREGNLARSRGTAHEKMYNLPDTKERKDRFVRIASFTPFAMARFTFQAYISRRSLVLEDEPDGSDGGRRFWSERFNFLFPLRASNSGIFVMHHTLAILSS